MKICKYISILATLALIFSIVGYKVSTNAIPEKLTMATGHNSGGYYQYAQKYKDVLKEIGINLEIVQTNGSNAALDLLFKKQVDMAFIQGGVAKDYHDTKLFSLGSVFYEPLWVFHKDDLKVDYLSDLKGKKVSIGPKGSGTKMIFETLLGENGISDDNLLHLSVVEGVEQLLSGNIDALCLVVSSESRIIKELLNTKGIRLMSFKRQASYKNKFEFMSHLKLTQGLIDLDRNIPSEDKNLLVTTASLVVNKNIDYNLQRLILKKIKNIHLSGGVLEPKFYFPSKNFVDIPMSEHAENYLDEGESWSEKYLPFWFSSIVEALLLILVPLIPILFIVIKFILPSYKIYLRHRYYLYKKEIRKMIITNKNRKRLLSRLNTIELKVRINCLAFLLVTSIYHDLILEIESVRNNIKNHDANREHLEEEEEL